MSRDDSVRSLPRWARVLGVATFALLLSVFAWWPALSALPKTQGGDGQYFHKMLEVARVTVTRYHEFPLWNPFECGGVPLWDNPQSVVGAPLAWLSLWLGTTKAMAWWYVAHSAFGFLSMWIFARHDVKLSRLATLVASVAWAFSGFHQQHYVGGHFAFVPFLYFPLALFAWRRAQDDLRFGIVTGAIVAWMMHEGGVYPIAHLAALLGVETILRLRRSTAWPIVRAGLVVVVVAVGLGATRFLPVFEQLRAHKRDLGAETDSLEWATLRDMFLARHHEFGVAGQSYVWPEYGTYFGPMLLSLSLVGLLLGGLELWPLTILLVFSFALMLGHAGKLAPWTVLKGHVFPFKEMRVPSRFRCEVSLFLAVFAGVAIDRIEQRLRGHARWDVVELARSLSLAVGLMGVGDVLSVHVEVATGAFVSAPEDVNVPVEPRLHYAPSAGALIDGPRRNVGRLECWDEWAFNTGAPLWSGDVPQVRSVGPEATIGPSKRTPNTFEFDVDAKVPARILLNSGYDRGFRTNVGATAELAKQLVVDVPAGHHLVRVRYRPRTLRPALVLTALTTFAIAGYLVWDARRRRLLRAR